MKIDIWDELKTELESRLNRTQFVHWVNPITAKFEDKILTLYCPNKMIKIYIEKNFTNLINEILLGIDPSVQFVVSSDLNECKRIQSLETNNSQSKKQDIIDNKTLVDIANKVNKELDNSPNNLEKEIVSTKKTQVIKKRKQIANHIRTFSTDESDIPQELKEKNLLNSIKIKQAKTFNNFVTGSSNSLAYSAVKAAAENPEEKIYSLLYLVGQSGLGKTHLLWAMGNEICKRFPEKKVVYTLSTDFRADYVKLLRSHGDGKSEKLRAMQQFYASTDVLLIDDIQLLSDNTETLKELFAIFNKLITGQRLIALTSDAVPNELKGIDRRLKTRFSGGTILFLEPPEIEHRIAITLSKAKEFKIKFKERDSNSIATYIAQNCRNNVREIEGALKTVASQMRKDKLDKDEKVSLDFVKNSLSGIFVSKNKSISPENIIKIVWEYYHITEKDLRGKKRHRTIADQRAMTMYLIKEFTKKSFPEIGTLLARDHSTVMSGCKKIEQRLKDDKDMQNDYYNLEQIIQ